MTGTPARDDPVVHVAGERTLTALPVAAHAPHDVVSADLHQRRERWWTWTRSCALGETLGPVLGGFLALVVAAGFGAHPHAAARALTVATDTGVCAAAGGVVGWFQWRVLTRRFPDVSRRAWLTATVAVTASTVAATRVAVSFGTSPAGTHTRLPEVAVAVAMSGAVAGMLVGVAQWLVLRPAARHASRWIVTNVLAWGMAAPVIFVATRASAESRPVPEALTAIVGALAAGLVVGAVTGHAFLRIPPRLHLVAGGFGAPAGREPRSSSG